MGGRVGFPRMACHSWDARSGFEPLHKEIKATGHGLSLLFPCGRLRLDLTCSGRMNRPCAKVLPQGKTLVTPHSRRFAFAGSWMPCPILFCTYRTSTCNGGLKAACDDGILCTDPSGKRDGAAEGGEDPPEDRAGARLRRGLGHRQRLHHPMIEADHGQSPPYSGGGLPDFRGRFAPQEWTDSLGTEDFGDTGKLFARNPFTKCIS